MSQTKPCPTCGTPGRAMWYAGAGAPAFKPLMLGNHVVLAACPACQALWCLSKHGLRGVPACGLRWERSEKDWMALYDRADGDTLRDWHCTRWRELYAAGQGADLPCAEWRARLAALTAKR